MAAIKSNAFLDAASDDDSASEAYNSEADQVEKGGRSSRKRKAAQSSDDDDDNDDYDSDNFAKVGSKTKKSKIAPTNARLPSRSSPSPSEDADSDPSPSTTSPAQRPKPAKLPLKRAPELAGKTNLITTDKAAKRSGVIYLSRIPPYMKPHKLRSLLQPYGTINRIFLAPESADSHAKRVRAGGNKKKMFTEGWLEFVDKKAAKRVCELLNARTIGGKKGTYYRDDIWNLLYLRGFKWSDLTAQIAAEGAERESRMRAELSRTTKENKAYVRNMERAKMLDGVKSTREKRVQKVDGADDGVGESGGVKAAAGDSRARTFKQIPLIAKRDPASQPDQVTRVLSKIF